jgi:hypothetical protein
MKAKQSSKRARWWCSLENISPRHSGAPRSGEPGTHEHRPKTSSVVFMGSGLAGFARDPE